MTGEERRGLIISRLGKESAPVSATRLAEEFSVSEKEFSEDIAAVFEYFKCLSEVTL